MRGIIAEPCIDSASPIAHPQPVILDTVEEPNFMAPLDHALANSHTDISPWTYPRDWIDADVNHITSTLQAFVTSMQSAEIENANFGGDMIYQVRLTVMIFK